jgi:hypothetical protein
MRFEPVVSNLCPMTLRNVKWNDVALNAEIFLGTVHEYVTTHGKPKPDSAEGCTLALKMATTYSKRMAERAQKKPPQNFVGAGTTTEGDAQLALVAASKAPASATHGLLEQIRKNTDLIPSVHQKMGDIPQQTAAHLDPRFDTLGRKFVDMQRENDALKQDLAQVLANLARRVEPEFFQWIFVILGCGSVSEAARRLDIPGSTFADRLNKYVAQGGVYKTLYSMVGVRNAGVGRGRIERFNEMFGKHQGVQAVAEPDVLRELLDGLEGLNGANWKGVREELIGLVKSEIPEE